MNAKDGVKAILGWIVDGFTLAGVIFILAMMWHYRKDVFDVLLVMSCVGVVVLVGLAFSTYLTWKRRGAP